MVVNVLTYDCALPWSRKGEMFISIVTIQGRTLLPSVNPSSYRVSFSGPASASPITTDQTTMTVTLAVGTWTIAVEGLDSDGRTIAQGSRNGLVVSPGTTTDATVSLTATSHSTGSIDITLNWPSGPPVESCRVTLGSVEKTAPTVTYSGLQLRYAETVASGSYKLLVLLLDSSQGVLAPINMAVQVYDNLTTSASITLTSSDFNNAPAEPTNLAVTTGSNALILSWDDNSHVETSYVVQRSTDNASWSDLVSLPSNSETYTDASAAWGTTYYYRVGSENSYGTAFSASSSGSWTQTGSVSLTISVISPTDATITFNEAQDIIASPATTLGISISETFDSYEWTLDGVTLAGQTGNSLSINCGSLDLGVHRLVVFVTRDGALYARALRFFVYN